MKRIVSTMGHVPTKGILLLMVVPIVIAVTLSGCSRSPGSTSEVSHSRSPLTALFKRQHAPAWVEIVYNDISHSRSQLGARASWSEIRKCVEQFLKTAPPGSKLEVWVTGPLAGRPNLVLEFEAKKLRPSLLREKKQQVLEQLKTVEQRILSTPPHVPYSSILEDSHRCALRALSLGHQKGARSKVVIHSDLQQFSANLKMGEILRDDKDALATRILRFMPKLEAPLDWSIVFYPGLPGSRTLSGAEEQKLQEFFRYLFKHWGSTTCEIEEPSDLGSTP